MASSRIPVPASANDKASSMKSPLLQGHPLRQGPRRRTRHPARLGAHPPRLQGGPVLRPRLRRLLLPPGAGRGHERAGQLRHRGRAPDGRLRDRGGRHDRALAREGPALRDAGDRDPRRRLGRRSRHLSHPAQAAHDGVPARGRPPAPAHQRDRRLHARAPHARHGDPPLLPRARLPVGEHAHHHGERRRGRGRALPRLHARPREPAAHARRQGRLRAGLLRQGGLPHRLRPAQRRELLHGALEGLHLRARPSAPRTPTPAGTSRSSG